MPFLHNENIIISGDKNNRVKQKIIFDICTENINICLKN